MFNVPRETERPGIVKPFDISVSSLDCLVELCPDGKVRHTQKVLDLWLILLGGDGHHLDRQRHYYPGYEQGWSRDVIAVTSRIQGLG